MNETVILNQNNLPAKLDDLTKFVLIGREKLVAVRAEIRAIDKVGLAKEVRKQKLEEAQFISEAVLDAEVRIGELMQAIPKAAKGTGANQYKNAEIDSGVDFSKSKSKSNPEPESSEPEELKLESEVKNAEAEEIHAEDNSRTSQTESKAEDNSDKPKTKSEIIKETGFTPKQAERFQQLASHPEAVAPRGKSPSKLISRGQALTSIYLIRARSTESYTPTRRGSITTSKTRQN